MKIICEICEEELDSLGSWATAKDLFPKIEVEQRWKTKVEIKITYFNISNYELGQWGETHEHEEVCNRENTVLRITGMCGLRNDCHGTGGRQKFCFFVFLGDSGHWYIHRSVASKGWLECPPENLLKRLRKLGIGADKNVIQQGDFLLKPANGKALADENFKHEYMGSGHHRFELPVLRVGGQIWVQEPTMLKHHAVDGIQHPDILVPVGKYIVGTTSMGLEHTNQRD